MYLINQFNGGIMKHTFTMALVCALSLAGQAWAKNEVYSIDQSHSNLGFKVKHLVISTVPGNFGDFEGSIAFDPAKPKDLEIKGKAKAASISTNNAKRDEHLRGDDFFAADKHPTLSFESTKLKNFKDNNGELHGKLTMRGVTKPVVFDLKYLGEITDPYGNEKIAFDATTTINRKDFGINWNNTLDSGGLVVSDEVTLDLAIQANKAKDTKKAAKKK